MTSSPAWGFSRPYSAGGHVQLLNNQPLNNQPLNNQVLDIQGAGWWTQMEKRWSIFHQAVVFFGGKGWLIPYPSC